MEMWEIEEKRRNERMREYERELDVNREIKKGLERIEEKKIEKKKIQLS